LPYGLLDVSRGFDIDLHATLKDRAEHAIRATWPEMDGWKRAQWLRELAEQIEAQQVAEEIEAMRPAGDCPHARICEQEGECAEGCTQRLGSSE